MLVWLAPTFWELVKGTVVLWLLNVLVAEVSVFVMLLPEGKLEVTSLASSTGEVALFAVKLKIKKKVSLRHCWQCLLLLKNPALHGHPLNMDCLIITEGGIRLISHKEINAYMYVHTCGRLSQYSHIILLMAYCTYNGLLWQISDHILYAQCIHVYNYTVYRPDPCVYM